MKKIIVGIVEDNKSDLLNLKNILSLYSKEKEVVFDIVEFDNAIDFMKSYECNYDIILLDIELGTSSGIDVAKAIRKIDEKVIIIFQTDFAKYALNGYEVHALDFMIKPIKYPSFSLKMDKALSEIKNRCEGNFIIPTADGIRKIDISRVLYIEVFGHNLKFHLVDEIIDGRGSLKQMEKMLTKYNFLRCNNCFLVNAARIKSIEKYECVVGNDRIQISHPKKKSFTEAFMKYLMNKED